MIDQNPRLLLGLFGPLGEDDLVNLFNQRKEGGFLRALLVALEYLDWSQDDWSPDFDKIDLRLFDLCIRDSFIRLLMSGYYTRLMTDSCREFVKEFDFLLRQSMFLNETLRNLTFIIVGRLWEKKFPLRSIMTMIG